MADKPIKLTVGQASQGDVLNDVIRLHRDHWPSANPGNVVLVTIGDKKVYANLRPRSDDFKDQVSFDLITRKKLSVALGQEVEIAVEKVGFCGELRWAWSATDAMPRVAARLGAISVGLGLLGLLLGAYSLIITLCQTKGA